MKFIDTHTHLYLPQFKDDIDSVLLRSQNNNVYKLVLPNIDSKTIEPLRELSAQKPDMFVPLIGLHPTHVKEDVENELELIINEFNRNTYSGIGEIGIDLYWDKTFAEQQKFSFRRQLQLAHDNELPVVIHARDSLNEIFQVLESLNYSESTGIFHAFTGSIPEAKRIIEMGYKIGIGGIVTFKNSLLAETVSNIDLNHIVLETDSPYLAPHPYRGKRNESSYLPLIAGRIAEIQNKQLEEVAEITTLNAVRIFNM